MCNITLRYLINTKNTRYKRIKRKSGNGKQQVLHTERQGGALVSTSRERASRATERRRTGRGSPRHAQAGLASCLLGVATHLRPADSIKLPTQRGSKWVCAGTEKGEAKKAEGHQKRVRVGKRGRITTAVTSSGGCHTHAHTQRRVSRKWLACQIEQSLQLQISQINYRM